MEKNIYIFKPSEHWSYCGGGRVVIAESFEEAINKFPDSDLFARTEEDAEALKKAKDRSWDLWVFVAVYKLVDYVESKIVLDDQNWG